MSPGSIGHGTVLAGRYRLADLLSDHDGAQFWRASDAVLSRDVAVHVVSLDDPRAAAMLDAARLAAVVHDPRLLRVLDADVTAQDGDDGDPGHAYVVHEWGDGRSVDLLLNDGLLTPRRAAWLVKEVAECLAACHVQGVAHGRLLPENVLINDAGGVKLIGFVVDSSLRPGAVTWPLTDQVLQEHEADMVNLAALLYACLTGRWPGTEGSDLPPAPVESQRVLRPRQVRAGVPRSLDRICSAVLSQPEAGVGRTTAHEVAATLAAYVGDPAPSEPRLIRDPAEREAHSWDPERDARRAAAAEDTAVGAPVFFDDDTAVGWSEGSSPAGADRGRSAEGVRADRHGRVAQSPEAASPVTAVDGVRPLFADDAPRSDPPPSADADRDAPHLEDSGPSSTSGSLWPLVQGGYDDDADTADRAAVDSGRGWMRLAGALTALLVVIAAVVLAFNLGQRSSLGRLAPEEISSSSGDPAGADASTDGQDDTGSESAPETWPVRDVTDFDPQGSDGENPELVGTVIDGDPETAWRTLRYENRADLGGLKAGVGLVLDLGAQRPISQVRLLLRGSPTSLQVLAAPGQGRMPTDREGFSLIGQAQDAGSRVVVDVAADTTTRYVGLWFTSLPEVAPARFQAQVAEVSVRS